MNSPQIDVYAVPTALPDTVATHEEDLEQPGGHRRRATEPRFARTPGWVQTAAASTAVLTAITLAMTHGSSGTANRGTSPATVATATLNPRGAMTCITAHGWPAMGDHAGGDQGTRRGGTLHTGPPRCPAAADPRSR